MAENISHGNPYNTPESRIKERKTIEVTLPTKVTTRPYGGMFDFNILCIEVSASEENRKMTAAVLRRVAEGLDASA